LISKQRGGEGRLTEKASKKGKRGGDLGEKKTALVGETPTNNNMIKIRMIKEVRRSGEPSTT